VIRRAAAVLILAAACLSPVTSPAAAGHAQGVVPSCAGPSECTIALSTGITMAYREVGPPDGPAVILLHGFPDTGHAWDRVLPVLTQELPGYHIVIPDLRGLGDTSLPADPGCPADPAGCFQFIDMARDIIAFMDARGIDRASVVGHSVGTLVAQELGLNYPDRVNRLVLISTAATGQEPLVLSVRDQVLDGWWRPTFQAAGYAWPDDVYPLNPSVAVGGYDGFVRALLASAVTPQTFVDQMVTADEPTRLGAWIGIIDAITQVDNVARLGNLTVPTLVLYGIQDDVFTPADEQALIGALHANGDGCSNFWWKQYGAVPRPASGDQTDIGHNIIWEAPAGAAADIASFLQVGHPNRTLYRTDPADPTQIVAEPGHAIVQHFGGAHCGGSGDDTQ